MTKTRILIVEDEGLVALDIEKRLKALEYDVVGIASSGPDALDLAASESPDLILMDIHLKGEMDGIEAAAYINEHHDLPIVFLTAFADGGTVHRAKLAEPYGYLIKPFNERDLQTTIELAGYRHKMQRKLRDSERWLSTTLRSIGDGVIATDAQGRVKFMNAVAERLTGWTQELALGVDCRKVFRIIDGVTRETVACPVMEALETGVCVNLANGVLLVTRDGRESPVDDSAAPIIDEHGRISGAVLVFRDVTERKEAQEAVRRYTEELRSRNEELDAFAHTVAHDLKNPLSLVMGFAQLLESDLDSFGVEELLSYLAIISKNSRKMIQIIDELLLFSQVRQTGVTQSAIDMAKVLGEACNRLAAMIEEYDADIRLAAEWPAALGYEPWVEEIWVNYLSNAIKYGGRPPRIEVGAATLEGSEPEGAGSSDSESTLESRRPMVRFWIRDNGPGIKPEDQAQLFKPYTRLQPVRESGHGLGLSIVRRIVLKLGGEVAVESHGIPGEGSVFSFTLPAALTVAEPGPTHQRRPEPALRSDQGMGVQRDR
jgi:two-component system cell cycle sensor histidine kinase/response regulator CckA